MKPQLLPLQEQVIVITGASSEIGLVTAEAAARAGAQVVLAARNESDLARTVERVHSAGGRAIHVVADVAQESDVDRIAETATAAFGRIDTWIDIPERPGRPDRLYGPVEDDGGRRGFHPSATMGVAATSLAVVVAGLWMRIRHAQRVRTSLRLLESRSNRLDGAWWLTTSELPS